MLPAVSRWWFMMNARSSSIDYVRRREFREPFQPKARGFDLAMPELPRLDDLVGLADSATDNADRVFDGNAWYRGIHQLMHELERLGLCMLLTLEPSRAANG
jgi:hypothetical protein